MTESEDKNRLDDPDENPGNAEDFEEERLLEFSDETAMDSSVSDADEVSESGDDYVHRKGGISVDEVLSKKRLLEFEPLAIEIEQPPDAESVDDAAIHDTRPEAKADLVEKEEKKRRPLEIRTTPKGEGQWEVRKTSPEAAEAKVRADKFEVRKVPGDKVRYDHAHLSKLDESLKSELQRIRKATDRVLIPGEFLEARRRLAEEGVLECPVCKIQVEDRPAKVDHCPKCGLALDDYLGEYKADWERKHKHSPASAAGEQDKVTTSIQDLFPLKKKRERTKWEDWKEEKGLDPEAELLACPDCSYTTYDDPFVANKCPKCRIPLDLHLQFPRSYIQEREKNTKGRRMGLEKKKKK